VLVEGGKDLNPGSAVVATNLRQSVIVLNVIKVTMIYLTKEKPPIARFVECVINETRSVSVRVALAERRVAQVVVVDLGIPIGTQVVVVDLGIPIGTQVVVVDLGILTMSHLLPHARAQWSQTSASIF